MHREDLVLAPARAGSVAGPHSLVTATGATYHGRQREGCRVGVTVGREPGSRGPRAWLCRCNRASCKFDACHHDCVLTLVPCYEATRVHLLPVYGLLSKIYHNRISVHRVVGGGDACVDPNASSIGEGSHPILGQIASVVGVATYEELGLDAREERVDGL